MRLRITAAARSTGLATLALLASLAGCSMTDRATHFEGLQGQDGAVVTHLNTTNVGCNLFIGIPLAGDATLDDVVRDLAREAKRDGATSLRIVQSDASTYWWVLPPFSFVLTPVVSNAAGDAGH